ncbi:MULTISPECIES: hypothetical protein [Roseomonadaceae]|uniref:Uncharacterized protein n=1 Tax=Falsiroseomonas oleicola TaxID=2801474 RepID=A0ABS6H8M7_9PROT|nr:hypothetical protein [Roseomonas oleicola]MBU8545044.1 hypothetical protein [Roseomonas oleicola]
MTDTVPTIATAATTAAEEDAEIVAFIAKHRERAAELRDRLTAEPINALGRRKLRADIAEAEAAIEDGEEARAALRPRLDAERAEAAYQRARDVHEAALRDVEAIAAQAQRIGEVAQWLAGAIATTAANIERVAHVANLPHEMILPGAQRFAEHIVGRLVHAGVLEVDLPWHLQAQAGEYVPGIGRTEARTTEQLLATDMGDAVQTLALAVKAHAPRSPMQHANAMAEREARRQREADELRKPLPKLPAPPPVEFRSAR